MALVNTHQFETWRQLILILSAILIGQLLNDYSKVVDAIKNFISTDGTLSELYNETIFIPNIIAALTILYLFRVIHGMLLALHDPEYIELFGSSSHSNSPINSLTMMLLLSSTKFAVFNSEQLIGIDSIKMAAVFLIGIVVLPYMIFVIYDFQHYKQGNHKLIIHDYFKKDKELEDFQNVWRINDIISFVLFLCLIAVIIFFDEDDKAIHINTTLFLLFIFLTLNSVIDYIVNKDFFFRYIKQG